MQRTPTSPHVNPATMPPLLYGTAWKEERTSSLVELALDVGFRGIDTACQPKHYDEAGVGAGVAACLARGLSRDSIYLQSKFTPLSGHDPERVPYARDADLATQIKQSCQRSLENLRTNTLDCLLLHSPLKTLEQTLEAWSVLEELVNSGAVASIGISNCYSVELFRALCERSNVKPRVLQNRFYAKTGYDVELRKLCGAHRVHYQSFWTLTANPHVLKARRVREIAERHGATVEQVFFRSLMHVGIVPLTGTSSRIHMQQDLDAIALELEPPELKAIFAELGLP
ncbi:MAG TPA: aldo/keto reductase [Polyangiaceae bacterium]|nr:aldo/keto reductase [Polyangiaceae bacterium]